LSYYFSILPPHQSQEAPARQSVALPHTAVLDTSGSCLAVLIIPLTTSRTAPSDQPITTHPSPTYTSIPPPLTPAAGTKYHRPHPQQSAGHSSLSSTPPPHQPAGYPGIIPLGAMHPEHPDLETWNKGNKNFTVSDPGPEVKRH